MYTKLEGKIDYDIKEIVLKNGKVINIENKPHVLIFGEEDIKNNNVEFYISYKYKENKKLGMILSNHCFAMANIIQFMARKNVSFEEAWEMHDEYLRIKKSAMKRGK